MWWCDQCGPKGQPSASCLYVEMADPANNKPLSPLVLLVQIHVVMRMHTGTRCASLRGGPVLAGGMWTWWTIKEPAKNNP